MVEFGGRCRPVLSRLMKSSASMHSRIERKIPGLGKSLAVMSREDLNL